MTDIEQKALALVREVDNERGNATMDVFYRSSSCAEALCRAIEQHEAFRQEVSDAAVKAAHTMAAGKLVEASGILAAFIIAKPDPLVEALDEALWEVSNVKLTDRELRAVSLRLNAKRGGKIVWGEG